ncbi:MAG: hypothetical protein P1V97_26455, partial [Planctomycetota bacterium]|nr:hypothetical protein [Planctomycetota bacterium]
QQTRFLSSRIINTNGQRCDSKVAAKAGFKSGDEFMSGEGRGSASMNDLRRSIQQAGGDTGFVFERGGQKKTLTAKFPRPRRSPNRQPGARLKVLGMSLTHEGLEFGSVPPGSVADKAGMKTGDTLHRRAGKALASLEELRQVIQAASGKTSFVFCRGRTELSLTADFAGEKAKKKAKLC